MLRACCSNGTTSGAYHAGLSSLQMGAGRVPCRWSAAPPPPKPATPGAAPERRVTIADLHNKKLKGEPLVFITAYDYSTSNTIENSKAIDGILVGDSLGMTMLGYQSTCPVTMDEMITHCKSVATGNKTSLLVGDMPFGSYEVNVDDAVRNALRFIKEGGMNCVKLEGGRRVAPQVKAIVRAGVPVIGHIGLTPQSVNVLSGYRVQAKTVDSVVELIEDAVELENAGCSAIVVEGVPEKVGELVTNSVTVPIIGIGAGRHTSGQILVWHDIFGMYHRRPKFCKQYRDLGGEMKQALKEYKRDVVSRAFPTSENCYDMDEAQWGLVAERYREKVAKAEEERERVPGSFKVVAPKEEEEEQVDPRKPAKGLAERPVVVIIGGGAMGSLLAAHLAAPRPEVDDETSRCIYEPDVWVLSQWSHHVEEVNKAGGLEIITPEGMKRKVRVRYTSDPEEILHRSGKCDVALVATKSRGTDAAGKQAKILLKKSGILVTMQNGLGNGDHLARTIGKSRVVQGTISHGAIMEKPGQVHHTGRGEVQIALPKDVLSESSRLKALDLCKLLTESGIEAKPMDDLDPIVWRKLIVNSVVNPLTALAGVKNGALMASPIAESLAKEIVNEGYQVMKAKGIQGAPTAEKLEEVVREVISNTAKNDSSMLQDVRRGMSTEVDEINGAIARVGAELKVETPLNAALARALSNPQVVTSLPILQPIFRAFLRI